MALTERAREVAAALIEHGSVEGAAAALGIHARGVHSHRLRIRGADPAVSARVEAAIGARKARSPAPASAAPDAGERHNAQFWRRRAAALEADLLAVRRLADQLAGVRQVPVSIPSWARKAAGGRRGA
jgi:hypothetical protein